MPTKQVIAPAGFSASGSPLSPGIKVGNTVYVSGQVGRHPTTGQMGSDIREQTRNCLERIKMILAEAGTGLDNFAAFNEIYNSYFPTAKPARATVEANLMAQGALVEIMVTACTPD
jgi:2-iminobutanoate/2-iminopropanoate deaminase